MRSMSPHNRSLQPNSQLGQRDIAFPEGPMGPTRSNQPDIQTLNSIENKLTKFELDFARVTKALFNKNTPTQIRQTPYNVTINVQGGLQLLLPANPNRVSFIVCAFQQLGGPLYFTYDKQPHALIGLTPGVPYQESFGGVSVNEIWVGSQAAGDVGGIIFAYEGLPAIESLQNGVTQF